jgi:hypothetical protein
VYIVPTVIVTDCNISFLNYFLCFRELVTNPDTGEFYKVGEKMKRPKLARTLQIIANEGADAFYTGSLAADIAADILEAGGYRAFTLIVKV